MISNSLKVLLISLVLFGCKEKVEEPEELNVQITDFDFEIETDGYYLDTEQVADKIAAAVYDTKSDYKRTLERNFDSQQEKKLISIAESLYPDKQKIIDLAENSEIDIDPEEENLWSYARFDGVRFPYATARASIDYYHEMIDYFRKKAEETPDQVFVVMAEFSYTATAEYFRDYTYEYYNHGEKQFIDFNNVYVVDLEIDWASSVGPRGGVYMTGTRTVIFDLTNHTVAIYGDGNNRLGFS